MKILQAILQKARPVKRIMIPDHPMEQQMRRIPKIIIPVPPVYISPRHPIKTVIEIVDLEEYPVADAQDSLLFVDDIIARTKPRLQLIIDQQGHTMVIGGQTPIVEMSQGLIKPEIQRGGKIVISQHGILLAIDPVVAKISLRAFLDQTELQRIGQYV